MVLALALLSVPVIASMDSSLFGNNNGDGIFETDTSSITFPVFQDTNIDSLDVGNDKAIAFGGIWQTGFRSPKATNNLEILKDQDSGTCEPCLSIDNVSSCQDSCFKVNLESIKVGNRDALAFGFATATNNVKIATNQM
jgi:hypothetical protein